MFQGGPITWLTTLIAFVFAWVALQQLVNVSKIKEKKDLWNVSQCFTEFSHSDTHCELHSQRLQDKGMK